MNSQVPFLDLVAPHVEDEDEFIEVLRESLRRQVCRSYGGSFEQFAAFCNTKYCVGVGSGTDALRLH
jgi:dTDP-4-amino-4,6-dideoxygalactose transaminase